MALVSASDLAEACGLGRTKSGYTKIAALARRGAIPFVRAPLPSAPGSGRKFGMMFDLDAGVAAFNARGREKPCGACGRVLPIDQFRKRGDGTPSHDCVGCHKAYNEAYRRKAAEQDGRKYRTYEDIKRDKAELEKQREAATAERWERERTERQRRVEEAMELVALEEARSRPPPPKPMPHARAFDQPLIDAIDREAFWSKVKRIPDGCWEWTGQRTKLGYGKLEMVVGGKRRKVLAHRAAWALTNGVIPSGMCILHHCDNPSCVHADTDLASSHLFVGLPADNVADMMAKGREAYPPGTTPPHLAVLLAQGPMPNSTAAINAAKTECPKCGGPLVASPHPSQRGRRRCPTCTRAYKAEHQAEWNRRHKAKRLAGSAP